MKFTLAASALALLAGSAAAQQAQVNYDQEHNFTSLAGTWASGSQQVLTGAVRFPCVVSTSSWVLIGMRAR
jgi:3-polyprenyl-4-hydroxybenzoate decarboxylase